MGSTRKIFIFLLVVVGLIVAMPLVVPLNVFLTDDVQGVISTKLKRRVDVGDMSFAYRPYPTLILSDLQIGRAGEDARISKVELQLDLLTLLSEEKRLRKVSISEGTFTSGFLQQVPELLKPGTKGAGSSYVARVIDFHNVTVQTPNKPYGPLEAEVTLNPDQSFNKVALFNTSKSVRLEIIPENANYRVILSAKNWEAPLPSKPTVEALNIEAVSQGSRLMADSVNGRVASGSFHGEALLDWTSGWLFTASIKLDRLDADAVTKWFSPRTNFSGSLNGPLTINTVSQDFDNLFKSPIVSIDFAATDGTVNNLDFVTPIRSNTGAAGKVGGSTRYDTLSGRLTYNSGAISVSGVKLRSGLLEATSSFNVNEDKKLSGSAFVTLGEGANRRSLPLRLTGTFDNPQVIPPTRSGESSVTVITD